VIFFVSSLAETNRPPFDLSEAESELVAGYQVEYSSTPYLLFMMGEYINIILLCGLIAVLFLRWLAGALSDAVPEGLGADPWPHLFGLAWSCSDRFFFLHVRDGQGGRASLTATTS